MQRSIGARYQSERVRIVIKLVLLALAKYGTLSLTFTVIKMIITLPLYNNECEFLFVELASFDTITLDD